MSRRGRRRRAAVLAATLAGLVASAGPAAAAVDLGVFSGPVRFEAPAGTELDVGDRRYVGTLEARATPEGMTLVDELSFDAYLEGLAEVPVSWHEQALRAQVVAARTYVWWELEQGVWQSRGYDVCATQACQVFSGRDVVEADPQGRWTAAVADTTGEVLLDPSGAPILARYSSTNGGSSRANEDVFPDDGSHPWLQAIDDPFDAVSPFHTWQVRFPRAVFDELVARGETLGPASPVADVELVPAPDDVDRVQVTGVDGTVRSVTAPEFRRYVTAVAPEVDPAAYPPARPDEPDRRMPATLLSSRLEFTVTDDEVVVDGRGFGHAVGMSQYGALGRAEAGQSYQQILAAYYGGIEPSTPDDVPAQVRVGLSEGTQELSLRPSGPVVVRVGDTVLTERGLGEWRVEARPDRTLRVVAPEGYGAPLVVDPTTAGRTSVWPAEVVTLETVVNKPVELQVVARDAAGDVVAQRGVGVADPGRHRVGWSLDDADGAALPAGSYDVALVAVDEQGTRAGAATAVEVRQTSTTTTASLLASVPAPTPGPDRRGLVAGGTAGLVVGLAVGLLRGPRRRSASDPDLGGQR